MIRRVPMAAVVLLLLLSCSGDDAVTETSAAGAIGTGDSRLLIHDEAGSIYTVAPDGSDRVDIARPPGGGGVNGQPAWSPNADRVAWLEHGGGVTSLVVSGADGVVRASVSVAPGTFYMVWSPDGERMMALGPGSGGTAINAQMVEVGDDQLEVEVIDGGSPYFFDWSPESDRYLLHVGPGLVASVALDGSRTVLADSPAAFGAPAWAGDRRVYAVSEGRGIGAIVVEDTATGATTRAVRFNGLAYFDLAGDRIAYQVLGSNEEVQALEAAFGGPPPARADTLTAYDLVTGEQVVVSTEPSVGFSLSPDGSHLAFLTAVPGERDLFRWNVWDGDSVLEFVPFRLKRLFLRDYLPFFDQYARSSTMWAPDSSAFAFAGGIPGGETGVFVQPVAEDATPVMVGEGDHVTWSGP